MYAMPIRPQLARRIAPLNHHFISMVLQERRQRYQSPAKAAQFLLFATSHQQFYRPPPKVARIVLTRLYRSAYF